MENIIYKILYIIIYSFLGWICEVIYCYILDHKFTNRGFLNGPLCPVYGFGALFVLTFLNDFRNNVFLVFILGVIITSVLEYVTSVILEVSFHTKWWDYSNHKFNIHGRVCLLNSTLFGILSVVLVEVINPAIVNLVSKFPKELVILITILLTTAIFVDFVITVSTMLKLNSKLHNLNGLANEFEELGISFIEKTEKDLDLAISKLNKGKNKEEILNRVRSLRKDGLVQRRILKAFPTMKHKKYDNLLQGLKKFNK
ncbi:putative ABC transporter permease [Clostridium sp. B9]|uniref:putative ABC transporter permease n=1 Tax=Clostridium sp. B9 TaxID=3423224 RepID=UPI003D2ED9FE